MKGRTARAVRTERAVSAGGVVHRRAGDGRIEVVVCGRSKEGLWGLPKGTPDAGESLEQTAVREVSEETGLLVEIERKIDTIEYWFVPAPGVRVHKWVHHYLMRAIGGSTDDHDHEYDMVAWMPIDEAVHTLSYENEANVVRKAAAMLRGEAA